MENKTIENDNEVEIDLIELFHVMVAHWKSLLA